MDMYNDADLSFSVSSLNQPPNEFVKSEPGYSYQFHSMPNENDAQSVRVLSTTVHFLRANVRPPGVSTDSSTIR